MFLKLHKIKKQLTSTVSQETDPIQLSKSIQFNSVTKTRLTTNTILRKKMTKLSIKSPNSDDLMINEMILKNNNRKGGGNITTCNHVPKRNQMLRLLLKKPTPPLKMIEISISQTSKTLR